MHVGERVAGRIGIGGAHHAIIRSVATVGANAVVPNRMEVPAGALAVGVPASVRPGKSSLVMIQRSGAEYVTNSHRYRESLVRID